MSSSGSRRSRTPSGTAAAIFLGCFVGCFLGCSGSQRATPDATSFASRFVFDPSEATTPAGERLAFGVRDDIIRNYFVREGPVAAHVLVRSGAQPRLIAAFPASNQGIGVWFEPAAHGVELSLGAAPDSDPALEGGELTPIARENAGAKAQHGVRATLVSSATELSTELVLLANIRTLRDYGYGVCLENAAEFASLRNETFDLDEARGRLRIRRVQIGGAHSLELWVAARPGTTLAIEPRTHPARPGCPRRGREQPSIVARGPGGIALDLAALSDEEPLSPIPASELFRTPPALDDPAARGARDALAFLSYDEKLLAGSWRFLTYFGRDTLLSSWLLMPALERRVVEAALGSVLERVELESGVPRAEGGVVDVGDIAHEEEVGDYAAYQNVRRGLAPADVRQPRHDYKMIDDDFLLAPLLVSASERLGIEAWTEFLERQRSDGRSFRDAALANLRLVLERARPFAEDRRAPVEKASKLVPLHDNLSVGQWRDSDMGLAYGRYPFDVNAGLVPGALAAAATLYERLGFAAEAAEASRFGRAWRGVEALFQIVVPAEEARTNVASYAASIGVADAAAALEPQAQGVVEYGIALDVRLRPLPVMHSDHGFVLAFTDPADAYLEHVAGLLLRPFPAGLLSPAGVMAANPALSAPTFTVTPLEDVTDRHDDATVPLRDLFSPAHYHGAVVWSWQQALLAKGLRRQLSRSGVSAAARMRLEAAECALWRTIERTRALRTRELWSWAPDGDGLPRPRPFGAGRADVDESNAIQLWSTVYLAVQKPTPAQNSRCDAVATGVTGAGR